MGGFVTQFSAKCFVICVEIDKSEEHNSESAKIIYKLQKPHFGSEALRTMKMM